MARLDEIFDLQMGKTPSRSNADYWTDGQYDWVSIADLGTYKKYVEDTKEKISASAVQESGIKSVPANTVIMSFKLSLGKTAITQEPVYTNEAIMAFIPTGKYTVLPDYFYYLLSAKDWTKGTNRAVMGATLNKATLGAVSVTVPPLNEQRKIVMILDKVSDLLAKHHQQLDKLDELVKSRFVEMFGDPTYNPKGYKIKKLSQLGELNRGVSKARPRNSPELLGGPYPLVQTGEVTASELYINTYENTYSEKGLAQSRMWPKGTLCITIAANIAQTAILNIDACFPDSVVGFIPGKEVTQIYMHYWFTFFQKILEEQAPQVAQKNINLKILNDLDVMVPERTLQEQFEKLVNQTDKSKLAIQKSLEKLEILKKALMQKYFG